MNRVNLYCSFIVCLSIVDMLALMLTDMPRIQMICQWFVVICDKSHK